MTEHDRLVFTHVPIEFDGRTLIESACKECGKAKLVSIADGSLEEWEERHLAQHGLVLAGLA